MACAIGTSPRRMAYLGNERLMLASPMNPVFAQAVENPHGGRAETRGPPLHGPSLAAVRYWGRNRCLCEGLESGGRLMRALNDPRRHPRCCRGAKAKMMESAGPSRPPKIDKCR